MTKPRKKLQKASCLPVIEFPTERVTTKDRWPWESHRRAWRMDMFEVGVLRVESQSNRLSAALK